MKHWWLLIYNSTGALVYEERFWLRRNAEQTGELYVRPLPMVEEAMKKAGYDGAPILTYEVLKVRRGAR